MSENSIRDCNTNEEGVFECASELVSEPVETTKRTAARGRPKTKPDSKPTIFYLSLDLIAKIDQEAKNVMLGNKSALATKIFSDYFASKV